MRGKPIEIKPTSQGSQGDTWTSVESLQGYFWRILKEVSWTRKKYEVSESTSGFGTYPEGRKDLSNVKNVLLTKISTI